MCIIIFSTALTTLCYDFVMTINIFKYIRGLKNIALSCFLAGTGLGLATATGCGITPMDLTLATQTLNGNVGLAAPPGISNIPTLACTSSSDCATYLRFAGIVDNRITATCDQPAATCGGDVSLGLYYNIDLSMDPGVTSGIVDPNSIRDVKLEYGITSTVNIDIQKIDVYLAPGTATAYTSAGVNQLGTVGPVPKMSMTTPSDQQYLLIPDGTPAHDEYIGFLMNYQTPFKVFLQVSTHLQAGDPFPMGSIAVQLVPVITVLKR